MVSRVVVLPETSGYHVVEVIYVDLVQGIVVGGQRGGLIFLADRQFAY